jgi:hypothetical protein
VQIQHLSVPGSGESDPVSMITAEPVADEADGSHAKSLRILHRVSPFVHILPWGSQLEARVHVLPRVLTTTTNGLAHAGPSVRMGLSMQLADILPLEQHIQAA